MAISSPAELVGNNSFPALTSTGCNYKLEDLCHETTVLKRTTAGLPVIRLRTDVLSGEGRTLHADQRQTKEKWRQARAVPSQSHASATPLRGVRFEFRPASLGDSALVNWRCSSAFWRWSWDSRCRLSCCGEQFCRSWVDATAPVSS